MKSSQFIRAKLVARTEADCSSKRVENNRYIYSLRFEQSIGWDWLYGQVRKASNDTETDLELWKIQPSGFNDFEIEVREVEQREGIDDNQRGLNSFAKE